jgi:hypothetical protein
MRRRSPPRPPLGAFATAALVLLALTSLSGRPGPLLVWFSPAPASLDMLRLFEAGEEWASARSRISIFKFYQQHTQRPAPAIVGGNSYDALRAVDAFRVVRSGWKKRTAVEVGAVKPFFCTADASGMNVAIRQTFDTLVAVRDAGGHVDYLALDEPFLSGSLPACGGPDPAPTVERLQRYFANVRFFDRGVQVGLIEPYPYFSAATLTDFIGRMRAAGIQPAFFHVDVDLNAIPRNSDTLAQDLPFLAERCRSWGIAFGVIIWGNNGDADALYVQDALRLARRTREAFPDQLPPHIIFQSWAQSRTGLVITPTNLPEGAANTHTTLIDVGLQLLTGPPR